MMDIEKNFQEIFFSFYLWLFLEKLDVKFPDDEDFYHIIWGFYYTITNDICAF